MGRQALRITILLGVLVTLLGGTGIFAVFTDRATAGENSVTSGERPRAADLQIEVPTVHAATGLDCEADGDANGEFFSDDTTTAQFTATNVQPNSTVGGAFVCIRNAGSATLAVTSTAIELHDLDTACTGDEAAAGDTTCGLDGQEAPQLGELSPLLTVEMERVGCDDPSFMPYANNDPVALSEFTAEPIESSLGPNQIACVRIQLAYPAVAEEAAQRAQTDRSTWRFAFDATAQ